MAEQADRESRTEEPTEKKILDEFEKGNIPISREASVFAFTIALLAITAYMAKDLLRSVGFTLQRLLSDPSGLSIQNSADVVSLFNMLVRQIGTPLIPILVSLLIAGLASSFLQHAPRIVFDRIQPDWNRISLINGWHRIFSARGQADFFKGVFKLLSLGIVVWTVLKWQRHAFIDTMSLDPDAIPDLILMVAMRLLTVVCVVTILLLAVDLVWVRMHWRREIGMSKQEIKDEMKQLEGDPLRKARLRSLALDRRRNSMIGMVPRATLVIANPTHYAIALRYVREEGGAPLVLSKGKDLIALKIREIAEQHSIPIIEDKLLARSMYDSVEVDRQIPPEFYKAVAELIHILYAKTWRKVSVK
jgi:flagellar biosynthesis protein FlhB